MGKKINPIIFRLKQNKNWDSLWYAERDYSSLLKSDILIKTYIKEKFESAFISKVVIERTAKAVNVVVHSARPGVLIGRGGAGIEVVRKEISRKYIKNKNVVVNINIKEVKDPALDARVVGYGIKLDIEKRMPFRRAMKQAISKVEKARAQGVKVQLSGRLNGVEIARSEKLISGKVPLHTIRADIDYAFIEANTIYGKIGIKVWIYKGDIFVKSKKQTGNEDNTSQTEEK